MTNPQIDPPFKPYLIGYWCHRAGGHLALMSDDEYEPCAPHGGPVAVFLPEDYPPHLLPPGRWLNTDEVNGFTNC